MEAVRAFNNEVMFLIQGHLQFYFSFELPFFQISTPAEINDNVCPLLVLSLYQFIAIAEVWIILKNAYVNLIVLGITTMTITFHFLVYSYLHCTRRGPLFQGLRWPMLPNVQSRLSSSTSTLFKVLRNLFSK